jgi:adenine/guanine/hypoxanthine permease
MLGTLAGIPLTFVSMRPAFQSWEVPWIAFITLGIVMVSWMANVRPPGNVPGGLVAVVIGTAIAWIAAPLGLSGFMQPTAVGQAFTRFRLRLPLPTADVFVGLADTGICVGLVHLGRNTWMVSERGLCPGSSIGTAWPWCGCSRR